jgi:hypothetical protein
MKPKLCLSIVCNWETGSDEAETTMFKVFKIGRQLQSEVDTILEEVKYNTEAGFISTEFLADGEILAIKYKITIQFASVASEPWILFKKSSLCDHGEVALGFNPSKHESYVLISVGHFVQLDICPIVQLFFVLLDLDNMDIVQI